MSIDKSLRLASALIRRKNVMTRAERIAELERLGRFKAGETSPFGLPKVRVQKVKRRAKKKKEEKKTEETPAAAPAPPSA